MPQPTASDWPQALLSARKALRLTRPELGRLARVSPSTIKAYEYGIRQPTRIYLCAILDALRVERLTRNEILVMAGFAPDGDELGASRTPHYMYSVVAAAQHVAGMPWPAFVLNDNTEVVACNRLTELLWGIELEREFPNPLDRSLVSVASNPRFADRVENWEEMVGVGISVFKGHHLGPEQLDHASPYFSQVLERFLAGDQKYTSRLLSLWQETAPREPKVRWEYEVQWNEPGLGRMRFLAVVNTASEPDGLAFNDWVPVGAETWERLSQLEQHRRK